MMGNPWWRPKNDAQRAMLDALKRGDHREYLRLVVTADLYLPQQVDDSDETERRLPMARELGGQTFVQVFISPVTMAAAVLGEADCYTRTTYKRLRGQLPPQVRLAIDPGAPMATFPTTTALDRALGDRWRPWRRSAPPVLGEEGGVPTFDPVMVRLLPVIDQDTDPAVEALLDTMVIAPTRWQGSSPEDLLQFPLQLTERDGESTVTAFTTADGAASAYPDLPSVRLPFLLLVSLQQAGIGLVVDPGGSDELVLRGDRLLLAGWRVVDHRPPPREVPASPSRVWLPGLQPGDRVPLLAQVSWAPPPSTPPDPADQGGRHVS